MIGRSTTERTTHGAKLGKRNRGKHERGKRLGNKDDSTQKKYKRVRKGSYKNNKENKNGSTTLPYTPITMQLISQRDSKSLKVGGKFWQDIRELRDVKHQQNQCKSLEKTVSLK